MVYRPVFNFKAAQKRHVRQGRKLSAAFRFTSRQDIIGKKVCSSIITSGIKTIYMDIYDCRDEYDFYTR